MHEPGHWIELSGRDGLWCERELCSVSKMWVGVLYGCVRENLSEIENFFSRSSGSVTKRGEYQVLPHLPCSHDMRARGLLDYGSKVNIGASGPMKNTDFSESFFANLHELFPWSLDARSSGPWAPISWEHGRSGSTIFFFAYTARPSQKGVLHLITFYGSK